MTGAGPLLYGELAEWWPLVSRPEDYAEEAGTFADILEEECAPRDVLELGCGGGNTASHLRERFTMTLSDRSPEMLAVSRRLNPDCEHVCGDMRDLRLGRTFDAVFVHDAVTYLVGEDDLRACARTVAEHLRPGGAALLVPDDTVETFTAHTDAGGHDGDDGRAVRYLSWSHEPAPGADGFRLDFAFLLRSADGSVEVRHDVHHLGLFPRAAWTAALESAGLRAEHRTWHHSEWPAERRRDLFVARRP